MHLHSERRLCEPTCPPRPGERLAIMQQFKKILFVGRGTQEQSHGLTQAIGLARDNEAELTAIHVCPRLPDQLQPYKDALLRSLDQELKAGIDRAREAVGLEPNRLRILTAAECTGTPVVHIIQRVLRGGYDLLVKEADEGSGQNGFRAFDMQLLRKCPCAVWLCRPITQSSQKIRVGVAIDPESHESSDYALSLELLRLGRSIADTYSRELTIISCWDFEYESYLLNSPWSSIPREEVRDTVAEAQRLHWRGLRRVITESGISGEYDVRHVRGRPSESVPLQVDRLSLDILVMGTVARTGIPGFFIGNTAENIVQKIACSLVALKPPDFVSPVRVD